MASDPEDRNPQTPTFVAKTEREYLGKTDINREENLQ